jgi:hypothetical protein
MRQIRYLFTASVRISTGEGRQHSPIATPHAVRHTPQMAWTLEDSRAQTTENLPAACGRTYYAWRRAINENGQHPRDAAESVGDCHYENLGANRYSIRLSQAHRVFFVVDEGNEEVRVKKVGTHLEPRAW